MTGATTAAQKRREQVIQAAIGVFLRYGYARTTMSDIAQAAALTRPTLYLTFPDKEQVFRAVLDTMSADMFAAIRAGLPDHIGLEAKLRFACESWGVGGLEMVLANPDAKDMFDLCFEPVQDSYAGFQAILVDILAEPLRHAGFEITAEELARIILFSIKGFKDTAQSGADMRRLIAAHVTVIAAAIDRGAG
ncbi:TetR/AcrR family transcriptional regulator [Sphingomonas sp.]|uniref:TetR/AcrR family transcriptional regulator n=1 Tax=Sphingomonas sp. TaxID=28214 RepID=UPI003D6CE62F